LEDNKIQAVVSLLKTSSFQEKIKGLGGYETTLSGQVMGPGMGLGGK
jgi:putative molybdopterin biosynthesis protein